MTKSMRQRSERQQEALLLLSKKQWLAGYKNVLSSIQLATSVAASTLGIQRCSVWLYGDKKSCIKCIDLYDSEQDTHDSGVILRASDFPHYFEALLKERIIAADDAHTNEYTYEFSDVYLKPLGISSMLDAPIWLGGNAIGVLCCEHVGEKRKWGIDEENFAASVADFASISFELAEHKKTSDELREHKNKLESIVNERTAELREKNDALEAFNYSVSHDLRAPLRHAAGYLQIIEEDYSDRIDDTGLDYIKRARDSLGKMNLMIDSMLNLSRITTHKMKKTEIDLSKLMKEIAGQLVQRDHPVDLRINNTPKAVGDAGLLQIALTNLLENALKYTQKVPDPVIEFGSLQIKNKTVYFLKDNGCGFDARYVDKLFAVFQRLHSDSEFEGAGIGLSTVQRVIQKHGGEIRAEGEVGKGASFYFSLGDK